MASVLPSHVFVMGTWEMREPGDFTLRNYEVGSKWFDFPKQGLKHEDIRHYMPSGQPASTAVGQVYSTFEKCIESMEKDMLKFKHNGTTEFDESGHCVVGRVRNLWFVVQKLWLNPKDHVDVDEHDREHKRARVSHDSPITVSRSEMYAALAKGVTVT